MIGIYKFTNLINNKIYIGLSNNIARRYKEHLFLAQSNKDKMYFHAALLETYSYWLNTNYKPVSTIPDHRQGVLLLLIHRLLLGNEGKATGKSKLN